MITRYALVAFSLSPQLTPQICAAIFSQLLLYNPAGNQISCPHL